MKEYKVIGHAISAGQIFVSINNIQRNLVEKAKSNGADAILITEIGRDKDPEGRDFDTEKQIKATLI